MRLEDLNDFVDVMITGYKDDESILKSRKAMEMLYIQKDNIEIYEESYKCYKRILETCADLANKLGLQNSLQICMLFTYMLWNGYFSVTRNNIYTSNRLASIEGLFPFDIMNGKGVCLNYSTMLRDLLIVCGYDSANLVNIEDKNIKVGYRPDIYRKKGNERRTTKFKEFVSQLQTKKIGNHAVTLINDNGNLYAYDPTNLVLLNIKNINEARVVKGNGNFKLKPYISYITNLPKESRKVLRKLYESQAFNNPYNGEYFANTFKELIRYLKENSSLLEKYYEYVFDDISYIAQTVQEELKRKR